MAGNRGYYAKIFAVCPKCHFSVEVYSGVMPLVFILADKAKCTECGAELYLNWKPFLRNGDRKEE